MYLDLLSPNNEHFVFIDFGWVRYSLLENMQNTKDKVTLINDKLMKHPFDWGRAEWFVCTCVYPTIYELILSINISRVCTKPIPIEYQSLSEFALCP